ncbi:hypothetical protein [Microtetraspora malaysiensis]|uniref:DUF91 domain-containing protein n=1 Tax=Microtetraspora malaysiensis TaxID=161358 RepID=A0ABW6T4K5_9ACTN
MGGDGLFHIDEAGRLVAMRVAPYEAEEVLQDLLATHPDLLAGGQMTPGAPRRWLLVRREFGIPDRDGGSGRWSLDHLFVDQDGVPTLVEVKRSSDSRIRREVVGQMLDYAANGVRYWPSQDLRVHFEQTQREAGQDPQELISQLCGDEMVTVEEFFAKVAENLRTGRIRMVFVADVIPDDLRCIVEFLNEQMNPGEVLAVEVKQYLAEGYPGKTLVPVLYGRTAAASVKTATQRPDLREVRQNADDHVRALWDLLERWTQRQGVALQSAPSGIRVLSRSDLRVAQLYPSDRVLCFNLDPMRKRGHESLAASCLESLLPLTTKALTSAYPSLPARDAVARWDDVETILDRLVHV